MAGIKNILNKMDNTAHRSHMKAIDEVGNKKYWNKVCNRLKRNLDDIGVSYRDEDFQSYNEYILEHEE